MTHIVLQYHKLDRTYTSTCFGHIWSGHDIDLLTLESNLVIFVPRSLQYTMFTKF